ncbi:unnamed protein product [Kuraishia capsulata CBS 1993]|uniref:Uncharacterized protein n=1 Tax=Kuraishia capsulata CBS 1993 TaxID=1382522 RepID=W6MQ46_9ASCO|nr:uncharacterized protein KUCA_T00004781001 [Kuraishia capsulata CBS 1993]CDK28796.1 unnamed protein product [Kuraishia capsulata CBS 1993]
MLAIFWVLIFITSVFADVEITSPAGGETYTVDGNTVSLTLKWKDDGDDPSIKTVTSYTFKLCTGPNTDMDCTELQVDSTKETSFSVDVDADTGKSGNYFFQLTAVYTDNGYTIHYSPRFKLAGMTGSSKASGSGTEPDPQISVSVDNTVASASFSVTYTKQTGKTRYAPMQMQPGSKVTAKTWSRRHATSSVSYYKTNTQKTLVGSTITPGWSYTMSSLVNYATPAPFPSEVGWYAASERLKSATVSDSAEKRRIKRRWDD